jgi:hypothetical protein
MPIRQTMSPKNMATLTKGKTRTEVNKRLTKPGLQ